MFLKDINAKETSDQLLRPAQVDCKPAETVAGSPPSKPCPAKNATCHYCQKVGYLAKVCLSKQKTKNVHEIEATSDGATESVLEPSQSSRDHMFLCPISATTLTSNVHVSPVSRRPF